MIKANNDTDGNPTHQSFYSSHSVPFRNTGLFQTVNWVFWVGFLGAPVRGGEMRQEKIESQETQVL